MHPFMYLAMHTRQHFWFAVSCQHECMLICSHWAKGSLGQAYVEKNPLAALQAFAIASGSMDSKLQLCFYWALAWVLEVSYAAAVY